MSKIRAFQNMWIWETIFLPLLVLTRQGAAPVKTSTGNDFPREYQRTPRKYYQHWCEIFVKYLPFRTVLVNF